MRYPQARRVLDYWADSPPEHEFLALFARLYTSWEPQNRAPVNEQALAAEHRRSLERRWQAGAMNARDLLAAFGGKAVAVRMDGTGQPIDPSQYKPPE